MMQPTGATIERFRHSPGVSRVTAGAWGQAAAHARFAGYPAPGEVGARRKDRRLGLALVTGTSAVFWFALASVSGLL